MKNSDFINSKSNTSLAKKLGSLHNDYKLFSKQNFNVRYKNNIINSLEDFPYLKNFYEEYQKEFTADNREKINSKVAKSTDLPFVGIDTVDNGSSDFIFYFEGSKASDAKLSITVLAHLWLTSDKNIINKFIGKNKWWPEYNYDNIKNKLNIAREHIKKSFITDAKRFESDIECSELIRKEIELLKPKLVICVGNVAKNLVGMRYYDLPTKFHHIKFPKYHKDNNIYKDLNEILDKL